MRAGRRMGSARVWTLAAVTGLGVLLGSAAPARALPPVAQVALAFGDKDGWKERDKREKEYYKREREYHKDQAKLERERAKDARKWAKEQAKWQRERYKDGRDWDDRDRWEDDRWDDDRYYRTGQSSQSRVRVRTLPTRSDRDGDGYPNRRDRFPGDPRRH